MNNQEHPGKKCIEYSIWVTGLRYIPNSKNAAEIISIASGFNLEAKVVGYCEASEKKRLTINSEFGKFEY